MRIATVSTLALTLTAACDQAGDVYNTYNYYDTETEETDTSFTDEEQCSFHVITQSNTIVETDTTLEYVSSKYVSEHNDVFGGYDEIWELTMRVPKCAAQGVLITEIIEGFNHPDWQFASSYDLLGSVYSQQGNYVAMGEGVSFTRYGTDGSMFYAIAPIWKTLPTPSDPINWRIGIHAETSFFVHPGETVVIRAEHTRLSDEIPAPEFDQVLTTFEAVYWTPATTTDIRANYVEGFPMPMGLANLGY